MPLKIVKPHDWQLVPGTRLTLVAEGVGRPGYTVRLYSYDEFFTVVEQTRVPLMETELAILPGGIARGVLEPVEPLGPCVVAVLDPEGAEVAALGVRLSHSDVTTWQSGGSPAGAGVAAVTLSKAQRFTSLSLPLSVGKKDPAFADMRAKARWTSNVPYIARFQNAVVGLPSGLLMFDAGLWSDSTLTAFFNDPELRQHDRLFRANDQVGTLGGASEAATLLAANGMDAFPGIPMLPEQRRLPQPRPLDHEQHAGRVVCAGHDRRRAGLRLGA